MIEAIVGILTFIMGTVFGSFFTLAVHRIPLKQNIIHERSYCPKCNHKLNFFDLIPVLSYICLRGKCRYCGEKIRPRYLILEISSGLFFMFYILSLKLDYFNIQPGDIVNIIFGIMYISILAITAGIDLEKNKIEKSIIRFTTIVSIIYMLYLYVLCVDMYRYIIYTIIIISLLVINKLKNNYTLEVVIYILLIALYIKTEAALVSIIMTLLAIALENVINIINKTKTKKMPEIAAIFSIVTLVIIIIQNYITVR